MSMPKSAAQPIAGAMHRNAMAEIAVTALPDDERVWVPQAEGVWFRPLMLDTATGGFVDLLRVRRSGMLARHRHPAPVHGYVISGHWRYLEHDWIASPGGYVYEPPGETHTLMVDDAETDEMVTFFHNVGPVIYVDADGRQTGYDDVFTKIDMCRAWYDECGLGGDWLDQFIR